MTNLVGARTKFIIQEMFRFIQFLRVLMLCMSSLLYNKFGNKRVIFGLDRCPPVKCLRKIYKIITISGQIQVFTSIKTNWLQTTQQTHF